jgi:hypothetical protein
MISAGNPRVFKEGTDYAVLRSTLKSGDLIFFRGAEGVSSYISRIESRVTRARDAGAYTHVGIIILSTAFPVGSPYRPTSLDGTDMGVIPYVFEATQSGPIGDGAYNANGDAFLGTQLRKLDEVVAHYDNKTKSRIALGRLLVPLTTTQTLQLYDAFLRYNGIRYALSAIDLFSAAFPALRWLRKFKCAATKKWMFCSELVANVLMSCNVIPRVSRDSGEDIHPEDVLPCDFISDPQTGHVSTYDVDRVIPVVIGPLELLTIYPRPAAATASVSSSPTSTSMPLSSDVVQLAVEVSDQRPLTPVPFVMDQVITSLHRSRSISETFIPLSVLTELEDGTLESYV